MATDVSAVQSQANTYATNLTNQWTNFLGEIRSLLGSGVALGFDFGDTPNDQLFDITQIPAGTFETIVGPALARLYNYTPLNVSFDGGTVPTDIPTIGDASQSISITPSQQSAVSVSIPSAPTNLSVTPPANPPAASDVGLPPEDPTLYVPGAVPTFEAITMPELEPIVFENFTGVEPSEPPAPSQTAFSYVEQPYNAALLTAVEAKLLNDLQNGGYGIDTDDEARLWERARDREAQGARTMVDEVLRVAASRGFSYPPGVMYALQQAALQEYSAKTSSVSRDIMSKKADLYVQNRQFTISQSKEVEQLKMNYHTSMMERALKTAQLTVELGIATYNAMITQYRAKVDFYKAQVDIWVQKRQAELYKVEVFKAKVQAEMAKAQINQSLVERYKAEISIVQTQVLLFDTEIKAYRSKIDAQQSLILAFKNQVDLYRAQVEGKQLELGGFKAQIDGELARVAAYKAQTDAHNGYIQAKVAEASVKEAVARTKVQNSQIQLEAYKTRLAKYQAELARNQAILGRDFSNESLFLQSKTAQAQTLMQAANLALEANKVNVNAALEQIKLRANFVIASGNVWTSFLQMKGNLAGQGISAVQNALQGAYGMLSGITAEIK